MALQWRRHGQAVEGISRVRLPHGKAVDGAQVYDHRAPRSAQRKGRAQSPQARRMLAEIQHQPHRAGPLAVDIEQNVRWRWKRLTRCIADRAERKQWNAVLGASARDKLRFHIYRRRACRPRNSLSLLVGIDHRRHSQKIGDMDRQICQQRACLAQFGRREVLRQ